MSNTNQLTAFQAEQMKTNSQIESSAKIGKQLIKAELKKRISELEKQFQELGEEALAVIPKQKKEEIKKYFHDQARLEITNDPEINAVVQALKKFNFGFNTRSPSDNEDMVSNIDFGIGRFLNSQIHGSSTRSIELLKKHLKEGAILGSVELKFLVVAKDGDYVLANAQYRISIPTDYYKLFEKLLALLEQYVETNDKIGETCKQLNGLDEIAEELEAKLLVKKLSDSSDGKDVLALTGSVVQAMLGDTPALLANFKESDDAS